METEVNPEEFEIAHWNSNRQGGFSLTEPSGVKVIHLPTGLITTCESSKSQHKNKHEALLKMESKLKLLLMESKLK